eukprot:572054-Prymnesium_polylepis.1
MYKAAIHFANPGPAAGSFAVAAWLASSSAGRLLRPGYPCVTLELGIVPAHRLDLLELPLLGPGHADLVSRLPEALRTVCGLQLSKTDKVAS